MLNEFLEVTNADLCGILKLKRPYVSEMLKCLRRLGIAERVGFRRKHPNKQGRSAILWRLPIRFTITLEPPAPRQRRA